MEVSGVMDHNSLELRQITHSDLPAYWRTAWWFLQPAVARSEEMTESSVCTKIATGQLTLFMVFEEGRPVGAATVAIGENDFETYATVVHLGGDFEKMVGFLDDLKCWARVQGAESLRLWGRRGWRKRAGEFGFKEKFVVMEARI